MNYKNKSLETLGRKYDVQLLNDDDKFILPIGEVVNKLELRVKFEDLESTRHAGYLDRKEKCICVNIAHSKPRQFFTISHELGHYALHNGEVHNRYDNKNRYTEKERKQEQEANDFAAELLMPEYKFVEIFNNFSGNYDKIASFFGTSRTACGFRAFSLGLIDGL